MRTALAGACLALNLGFASCSQNVSDTVAEEFGAGVAESARSITATQLLETTKWPDDLNLVALSPTALRQLQRSILGDVEMARAVSDVAAAGFLSESEVAGAVLLIGVNDPVVGNMSFVEGVRRSALDNASPARWGALLGWVSSLNGDTLAIVPIGPVVVFATASSRVHVDRILMPLIARFVTYSNS